ncbi:hypothetical protein [Pararhodobacter sp.]
MDRHLLAQVQHPRVDDPHAQGREAGGRIALPGRAPSSGASSQSRTARNIADVVSWRIGWSVEKQSGRPGASASDCGRRGTVSETQGPK